MCVAACCTDTIYRTESIRFYSFCVSFYLLYIPHMIRISLDKLSCFCLQTISVMAGLSTTFYIQLYLGLVQNVYSAEHVFVCCRIYFIVQNTCSAVTWTFRYLAVKVGYTAGHTAEPDFGPTPELDKDFIKIGLENNICLPETSTYH